MIIISKNFWDRVFVKLVETFISVKVWTIFTTFITSTLLLLNGYISDNIWSTINSGVIATVFALRESFKVARINIKETVKRLVEKEE